MNLLLSRSAFAEWVSGPRSSDAGNGMVIDADGSVFIPGSHDGLDLNRNRTIDIPADGIDAFFMKLEPTAAVEWIRSPSGPQFDAASRMALDTAGGIYGIDALRDTVPFDDRLLTGTGRALGWRQAPMTDRTPTRSIRPSPDHMCMRPSRRIRANAPRAWR